MKKLAVIFLLHALTLSSINARVWYVNHSATGNADGSFWNDAFTNPQDALAMSQAGDEIWIAAGMYAPDIGGEDSPGDRNATFQLVDGVSLYGGFNATETERDQRNSGTNVTILSGDLLNNDLGIFENTDDNSYHVIFGEGISPSTELDGLTITHGSAEPFTTTSARRSKGGGILLIDSAPIVSNCSILKNFANFGGGIATINSSPIIRDCEFIGNFANGVAGGMSIDSTSSSTLINCKFLGNIANSSGGALEIRTNKAVTVYTMCFQW